MPKEKKTKQKIFRIKVIKKYTDTWKSKAKELELVAKDCYQSIRSYIPKYESTMTYCDKKELLDLLSIFF